VLLSLMITAAFMPYQAYAETEPESAEDTAAVPVLGLTSESVTGSAEDKLTDSDELLMQYLEKGVDGASLQKRSLSRRSSLSEKEQILYDSLRTQIKNVASGSRSDTLLKVSIEDMLEGKLKKSGSRWVLTKSALGVSSIIDQYGQVTNEALEAFSKLIAFDGFKVIDALLFDLPYEFYWFDKTVNFGYSWDQSSLPGVNSDEIYFPAEPKVAFTLCVSPYYSVSGKSNTTKADTSKTKAASTCVTTVRQIIEDNADKTYLQKLYAYKDEICDLTDYNHTAMSSADYGDPWQLIWVFDNDPSTKVVCEGYSKAFKFLCDKSALGSIECWSVTGVAGFSGSSGGHMWNIVHMDDKHNYLVDITNCDGGTAAQSDDELFLKGAVNGDPEDGYSFSPWWGSAWYRYDDQTLKLYSYKELILSLNDYGEGSGCSHSYGTAEYTWSSKYHYVTAVRVCSNDGYKDAETVRTTHVTTEPTCTAAGYTRYTARFTNSAFTNKTKTVKSASALGHDLKKLKARAATIKEAGRKTHWKCTRCGKRFSDSKGKNAVSKASVTIPKLKEVRSKDGSRCGKGASAATADYAITTMAKDADPVGSKYAPLMLRSVKQTKSSITITWKKNKKAVKYVIYGNRCGKTRKPVRLATVKSNKKTFKKVAGKKIKKGKYYKFIVVALDSKGRVVSTSKLIHVAAKNKKNFTKVTTKAKGGSLSLKKGASFRLRGKAAGGNVKEHVGVRYESSNAKVATVTKSGKVKAVGKGSCKIYAYAQNGVRKIIKVTVR